MSLSTNEVTAAKAIVYQSRRPENTVLYQLIAQNFNCWYEQQHEASSCTNSVPRHIEKEFRSYLECGILAYGFARVYCDACGHDFLVAFSCKGRGVCPSCTARRMVEIAAHLIDNVFPKVPVRQWVLAVPKRIRYYLYRDHSLVNATLKILINEVEKCLKKNRPGSPVDARLGGVTFIQRFGSTLNVHPHYHCLIINGVFNFEDERIQFYKCKHLGIEDIEVVQARVRKRVLNLIKRRKILEPHDVDNMREWKHGGGFSLNADVSINAEDRRGLERLIRYCARPVFSGERIKTTKNNEKIIYELNKPSIDGKTELVFSPLEFIDKLAKLIPPPRKHRNRYHGVLAPNSPYRSQVTAYAGKTITAENKQLIEEADKAQQKNTKGDAKAERPKSSYLWAKLITRIFESFPLECPHCKSEMRLVAFITERQPIKKILTYIGEPSEPPKISEARGPPDYDEVDQRLAYESIDSEASIEEAFDQSKLW